MIYYPNVGYYTQFFMIINRYGPWASRRRGSLWSRTRSDQLAAK